MKPCRFSALFLRVSIIMTVSSSVRLSVVLPAYNEEFRLPHTLAQSIEYLKSQPYNSEIIVVDDGSTDRTCDVVRNHGFSTVPVILLSYRLFMDADNSTTLEQVESFWPHFESGYDVVIGSRALKESFIGKHQARYKELAGRAGNWFVRFLAVPGVRDTQAGFKMFTGEMADKVFSKLTIDRWGADIEMIVIARLFGCRIIEVPITWLNAPGSKVTMASYLQVFSEVLRIRRNIRAGLYK
jgi:dolichyl-phosphate beta-glucosyltransferase